MFWPSQQWNTECLLLIQREFHLKLKSVSFETEVSYKALSISSQLAKIVELAPKQTSNAAPIKSFISGVCKQETATLMCPLLEPVVSKHIAFALNWLICPNLQMTDE